MREATAWMAAVTLVLASVAGVLGQAGAPEVQGDSYTEPVGLPLPQEGFDPRTTVVPVKIEEQPAAGLKVAGGTWNSRVGDAARAAKVVCLVPLGLWPSAESKVGQRCIAAAFAALRPYPPEELPLTERWKPQAVYVQLWPEPAWNLTGRQALVFWLRVSNPRPFGPNPKAELVARSGDKLVYAQGGTAALLAALAQGDTWQEVRLPLAEITPLDSRIERFPVEQVIGLTISLHVNTPEVFTEVVWIDGLRFE